MRRISAIAVVGMLALTMAGCGSDSEDDGASSPDAPQQVVKTEPAPKPFEKPAVVPQTSAVKTSSASGLIQSTNANQRAKQVETGRKDPFAGLFAPVVVATQTPPPTTRTTTTTTIPAPTPQKTVVAPLPKPPVAPPPQPVVVAPTPPTLPPVAPAPPPAEPVVPPQPDLATGITVTGVVQIGDEIQAIVLIPNEGTSRYIREGQLLSNGQVLVKRIEVNQGAQPLVILEEKGIEVAKAVGEPAANAEQNNTPTATNSSRSPSSNRNVSPRIPSFSPSNNRNTPTTSGPSSLPPSNRNAPPSNFQSPPQPSNISPPTPIPSPSVPQNNDNDSEDER